MSDTTDDMEMYSGLCDEDDELDYDFIKENIDILIKALRDINKNELNIQRPGGGLSLSAKISYSALRKIGVKL